MTATDKILKKISDCIDENRYEDIETDRFELKDLSTKSDWTELYRTVNAFLNTNGGIVIVGVKDKNNEKNKSKRFYKFTGFNYDDEAKVKEIPELFTDKSGNKLDLKQYFPNSELRDFRDGKVLILYVEKLPEDEKYVFYNSIAYKRNLTGDHKIDEKELVAHEELLHEYLLSQELSILENVSINNLNIEKINQYIIKLNRGKTVETLKSDINSALSFLNRKSFIRNDKPTLLGYLVCGDYPEDYISGKCEVDCYVKSPQNTIEDKLILRNNIIPLMEDSIGFLYKNIKVGISRINGGTAIPEYPEELLEETINNALAHRDYKSNRFCIIEIEPDKQITVRNPGSFRETQKICIDTEFGKIRRIIPTQYSRNPKLTDLLKSFDRWEGKGKGLSSLTDACLNNTIDIPYYQMNDNEIKLFIPKGKVLDDAMQMWFSGFSDYILQKNRQALTEDEKTILSYFYKSELMNNIDNYTILLTTDNNHKMLISNLEAKGLLIRSRQSPEYYPIFLIDRVLAKTDFSDELYSIFADDFLKLHDEQRQVLNLIYQFNFYSASQKLNANFIANTLFIKNYSKISDVTLFEKYKSKIKNTLRQLEKQNYLVRKNDKPDFIINHKYL